MGWNRSSTQSSKGELEEPMLPSQPPPPTSKRKADDLTALGGPTKRPKKDTKSSASNKRKLFNGEELPGGLMISRVPGTRQPGSDATLPHSLPTQLTETLPAKDRPPPSKKFRADTNPLAPGARPVPKGKDREILSTSREDPEVEEDVRRMNSEADDLRRLSRANESSASAVHLDFNPSPSALKQKQHRQQCQLSSLGSPREVPLKGPREGQLRRKSSLGMRGKRISTSFEATGVISHPHNSVSDSSFYKHIDCDLPPSARARQLLIWCSSRAMTKLSQSVAESSSSKRKAKNAGKDPPLSEKGVEVLKSVEEDVIRLLADRKIDTNVFSGPCGSNEKKMKENAQNVRNRQCKVTYTAQIERAEAEAVAWAEADQSYDARLTELVEVGQPCVTSAKAKGKQRAASQDPEDSSPRINELPERFRGGMDLALKVLGEDHNEPTLLTRQLNDLEFEIDSIHAFVNSAVQCINAAENHLDHRFALLSFSLASRSELMTPHTFDSANAADPTTYLPASLVRAEPYTTDPQELLRALSRVDAGRPPGEVGDAARRAVREVQRVMTNETAGGAVERRLTEVMPLTPRKMPGTPRRPTTTPKR